jgi:hypothetical protein
MYLSDIMRLGFVPVIWHNSSIFVAGGCTLRRYAHISDDDYEEEDVKVCETSTVPYEARSLSEAKDDARKWAAYIFQEPEDTIG